MGFSGCLSDIRYLCFDVLKSCARQVLRLARFLSRGDRCCHFVNTPETFGCAAIHNQTVGRQIADQCLGLDWSKISLSEDQQYLAAKMGVALPALPVHGIQENSLFNKLAVEADNPIDFAL